MHRPGMIAAVLYPQLFKIGRETMNESEMTEKVVDEIDRAIPCPFCGEELYLTTYGVGDNEDLGFAVVCDTCGASGGPEKTHTKAVDKWNKRRGGEK